MLPELDDVVDLENFNNWQSSLIFEKNKHKSKIPAEVERIRQDVTERQTTLMAALKKELFKVESYLLNQLKVDITLAEQIVPELPREISASEIYNMSIPVESSVWKELIRVKLPSDYAADPRFWTLCHAIWIGEGMFGDDIPSVFCKPKSTNRQNPLEAETRTFLRRMGGLRIVRGNLSVFDDCTIAKAYWRGKITDEAVEAAENEGYNLSPETVHEILHIARVWTELIRLSFAEFPALNHPQAQAAFLIAFEQEANGDFSSIDKKAISGGLQALGELSHDFDAWYGSWRKLVETARTGIREAPLL